MGKPLAHLCIFLYLSFVKGDFVINRSMVFCPVHVIFQSFCVFPYPHFQHHIFHVKCKSTKPYTNTSNKHTNTCILYLYCMDYTILYLRKSRIFFCSNKHTLYFLPLFKHTFKALHGHTLKSKSDDASLSWSSSMSCCLNASSCTTLITFPL